MTKICHNNNLHSVDVKEDFPTIGSLIETIIVLEDIQTHSETILFYQWIAKK
jgi:hypothetical protein